jgi:hypothetical protein
MARRARWGTGRRRVDVTGHQLTNGRAARLDIVAIGSYWIAGADPGEIDAVVLAGCRARWRPQLVRDMPHRLRASLRDRAAQPFEWKFTRGDLAELLERIAQHKPLPNAACISVRNLPARALSAVAHVMLNASDRRGRQKRRQRLRRWVRYVL